MTKRLYHLQKATGYAGSEEFLVKLGQGLSARGWSCGIGVIQESDRPADQFISHLEKAGWTVDVIPMDLTLSPAAVVQVHSILRDYNPDLINTHLIHGDLIGALSSVGLDVPVISTKHNDDRFKHRWGFGVFAQILNWKFDHLVTISDHLKNFYQNQLGITNTPYTRIHYGLDPDQFLAEVSSDHGTRPPVIREDAVTFGMVARLTEQKGHDTLLEAFERLPLADHNSQLILVGSGPLEDELKTTAEAGPATENIHFLGHRSDVPQLLSHFDVFVHPSRWEGFGLVFLEAMAARLPVVATNVSAIPEIVRHRETGLLVEPDRVDALSEAMESLLVDPERRSQLGRAGRKRLEKCFSVERMIDQYEELYTRVIGKG
ncbi:MAG: glycosyltransferase family 4 protein [bacterium]